MDEVALAFTYSKDEDRAIQFTLHKHGRPELVDKWFVKNQKKCRDSNLLDLFGAMYIVRGKFPVEELNKCISNTGYIGTFLKNPGFKPIEEWNLKGCSIHAKGR